MELKTANRDCMCRGCGRLIKAKDKEDIVHNDTYRGVMIMCVPCVVKAFSLLEKSEAYKDFEKDVKDGTAILYLKSEEHPVKQALCKLFMRLGQM